MLFSYNWLQKYFDQKLPEVHLLADKIIFHSFEVEEIINFSEGKENDFLLDIKILPDRTHDCLSHYGLAKEITVLFDNLHLKSVVKNQNFTADSLNDFIIKIDKQELCRRYIGQVIKGVTVKDSPSWLKENLTKLGQRSVNNVVDLANYVMFDVGQPLHVFDADKVVGPIVVRLAKAGEKITTLDDQELALDETVLVIADNDGPLAIAGIKGGKKAEVTNQTKNLILESANFDPVHIRKTTQKINLRTEASKRFENELSTAIADYAIDQLANLIVEEAGTKSTMVGKKIDKYLSNNLPPTVEFGMGSLISRLGVKIDSRVVIKILERLGIQVTVIGDKIKVVPPAERLDLVIKENYLEEVGRVYGYDKIVNENQPETGTKIINSNDQAEKRFNFANGLRLILKNNGFTELYGYSFSNQGELELLNPLSLDKKFLRSDLVSWLKNKIETNLPHLLFDNEPIKVFEIGKVFIDEQEETRLILGVAYRKQISNQSAQQEIRIAVDKIQAELDLSLFDHLIKTTEEGERMAIREFNFDTLVRQSKKSFSPNLTETINSKVDYKIISPYPRIIRDIAVWVPQTTKIAIIESLIKESAGELRVVGPILFDEFSKEDKKSLAFRLVFQSHQRTLLDSEINDQMTKITDLLESQGYEVRK